MCVVNMVVPNLDIEFGNSTYRQTSNLGYFNKKPTMVN